IVGAREQNRAGGAYSRPKAEYRRDGSHARHSLAELYDFFGSDKTDPLSAIADRISARQASISWRCVARIGLVSGARILATKIIHAPLGMFADPLCNIELRRHCTPLQRTLPCNLEVLFLAKIRLSQPANHHDDLNHCHACLARKTAFRRPTMPHPLSA